MAAPDRPARRLGRLNPLGLATAVALLALWEVLVDLHLFHFRYLPAPSAIAGQAGALFSSTHFLPNLGHTVMVTLVGWVASGTVGIAIGVTVGLSPLAWRWSIATVDLLRALPAIAFVPVAVLIFGLSSRMELFLVIYVAFWPVVVNAAAGVRDVSPLIQDVGRTFRLTRVQTLRKIVLPSAAAPIVVGLRLALTLSLVLAVVAEMVGNPTGLGYQLVFEQQALKPDLMFGYVAAIGVMGVVLNGAFVTAVRVWAPGLAHASGVQEA